MRCIGHHVVPSPGMSAIGSVVQNPHAGVGTDVDGVDKDVCGGVTADVDRGAGVDVDAGVDEDVDAVVEAGVEAGVSAGAVICC